MTAAPNSKLVAASMAEMAKTGIGGHLSEQELEQLAEAALAACEAEAMREMLRRIKEHTDPEPPEENYRADDREGCLDTVFSIASTAIARLEAKP